MQADEKIHSGPAAEPEVFLQHYRAIEEEGDNVEDAKALQKSLIAKAAASGVHVKAMKQARKIVNMGIRDGKTYWDFVTLYTNLITGGMLDQKEMFASSTVGQVDAAVLDVQRDWISNRQAERIGYSAGKNGEPNDNNPHPLGSSLADKWARGWADGHEDFVAGKGMEIHPKPDIYPEDEDDDGPEGAPT